LSASYDRTCLRCGWDNQVGMRKCVTCKGPVILHEAVAFGPISGVVGVGGVIFWRLFGLFLGLAIICAIGSLCGLVSSVAMSYSCSPCRRRPQRSWLSREEKKSFQLRRLGFLIGTVGLAVGSLVLFLLFAAAMGG
jgi:hypothetical protein